MKRIVLRFSVSNSDIPNRTSSWRRASTCRTIVSVSNKSCSPPQASSLRWIITNQSSTKHFRQWSANSSVLKSMKAHFEWPYLPDRLLLVSRMMDSMFQNSNAKKFSKFFSILKFFWFKKCWIRISCSFLKPLYFLKYYTWSYIAYQCFRQLLCLMKLPSKNFVTIFSSNMLKNCIWRIKI